MIRKTLVSAAALLAALSLAAPAGAVETAMQLTLTLDGNAQRDVVTYQCGEDQTPLRVEYINAEPIFLAILPVEEETLIFVNVISGSGARYASGPYVWWTRGAEASLYDEMAGEDAEPVSSCIEVNDIP